ncbi:ATP-dependent zinc metalloprotease FtsH 2 [Zostera marina]|uniref:ATP-dependent zinc metalloprotease FtsH 2 n=1 Tax=Zostera marina TaxID=29655 RepID=A0A0K9PD08_ZOSMR|nr:ATP-dependent zinc metalloprotease FtsH 2 [Zostera marina]
MLLYTTFNTFPTLHPHPIPLNSRFLTPRRTHRRFQKKHSFRSLSARGGDGSGRFSWESVRKVSNRFWSDFGRDFNKEFGVDLGNVANKCAQVLKKREDVGAWLRSASLPSLLEWHNWDKWKDVKNWDPKRVGVLILYTIIVVLSSKSIYFRLTKPQLDPKIQYELFNAYMEAVIPEPTPTNIRELKKNIWRKKMPKGLIIKKGFEGPDGKLVYDKSYIGEDAWIDERNDQLESSSEIAEVDVGSGSSWRERLVKWREIIEKDKFAEKKDSLRAKYVIDFDMEEVEKELRKEVSEKSGDSNGYRALWVSKRWWLYRPKLPYTYFLEKLHCSEVDAVLFTEDLKRIYVTMKEGYPSEYIVDIPLDPYLFEVIFCSRVEVDILQKGKIHYILKVVMALLPALLILTFIRESTMLLHIASSRFLYKKYNQIYDMAYAENFILPIPMEEDENSSMYKDVVLGGDVWDLVDEIMIYMRNPMRYYEKKVTFVRGILLSGPPGTGKTLFARSLSKESGMPFIFASGAEFSNSEKSGAARINEIFSMARRNAPCFIFVDEIDAIAGRHAKEDPRRYATYNALLTQLDGEKEKTGVDRFSLQQAIIFICATNRPDELDDAFVSPGRIDRRLHIGLPDSKQRIQIFDVHSAAKKFSDDVDFSKLILRTVGYSGAEIRNLINESAIMAVRKGHTMICQQDIVDVLDKQLLESMDVLLTLEEQKKCVDSVSPEKKRLLAVHEAGHILLAHLFPKFDCHAFSQLLPGGKECAVSVFSPMEDMVGQGYTTFGYMKMQMIVAHGGRCAERIVFGDDITDEGKDDLERISKIGREMVISPNNRRLGLTRLVKRAGMNEPTDSADDGLITYRWDDPNIIPEPMSLEVSELFTRELTRYIEETEEYAMRGLQQNKHILEMIIRTMLDKSHMTGLEAKEKIKDMSPVMFEDLMETFQIDPYEENKPILSVNAKIQYQPLDIYPAPLHRC